MKTILFSLLVLSISFVSCNQNTTDVDKGASKEMDTKPVIQNQTNSQITANNNNTTATQTPAKTGPQTTVELSKTKFDFGTIQNGDVVNTTFMVKNTGTNPMIINDAKTSCGCTVPKIEKNVPIAPGESTEVEVKFDSKNKPGRAVKTVTLKGNFPDTRFTIEGDVEGANKPTATVTPAQQ